MTAQFKLTESATQDIEEIADYLSQQSGFDRAERFVRRLNDQFSKIAQFPHIGRSRNEISEGIRSFPVDNSYLILYISAGPSVEILRVVSSYRDLKQLFKSGIE